MSLVLWNGHLWAVSLHDACPELTARLAEGGYPVNCH
jgi:hypothetical protein